MSDVDEIRANAAPAAGPLPAVTSAPLGMPPRMPASGLLWLLLATAYLLASIGGYRAAALGIIGLMFGALIAASGHRIAGLLAGLLLAGACMHWADSLLFLAYAPPLAAFAFMAYFFQRTLRPGVDPLITRVARREYSELPPDVASYTRMLTCLWALCFAGLLLLAFLLVWLLPLALWSCWVHGLGYVVPGLFFVVEYGYRHRRFPAKSHASLPSLVVNIIGVINEAARNPAGSPAGDHSAAGGPR